jgi:hypothetical protein
VATTYTEIDLLFRIAIEDSEEPYNFDPGDTNALVAKIRNSALQQINRLVPHIPKVGYLHPDGVVYQFNLRTALKDSEGEALSDFYKVRLVTIVGANGGRLKRHGRGINYIRDLEAGSTGLLSYNPSYYAINGNLIFFSSIKAAPADPLIPTSSELFTIDYYGLATELDEANPSPEYPLDEGFTEFIVAMMMMISGGTYIKGEWGAQVKKEGYDLVHGVGGMEGLLTEFRGTVDKLGIDDDTSGMIYSDHGEDVISSPSVQDELLASRDWSVFN